MDADPDAGGVVRRHRRDHPAIPDRGQSPGPGRGHGHPVRARHRSDLRHHVGWHRPLDPGDGLAGQRHRGAHHRPARLWQHGARGGGGGAGRPRRRPCPCPAADPLVHRYPGHRRRARRHRAGHLAGAVDHAGRDPARLARLGQRHQLRHSATRSSLARSSFSVPISSRAAPASAATVPPSALARPRPTHRA